MKYETVIFDLDGTLLDTLDDLCSAVNAALAVYGFPSRSREEVRSFIGDGLMKLMERAVNKADFTDYVGIGAEFRKYYKEHCKEQTAPYAGVMTLLKTLKECGIKTAVVSNKADFAVKLLAEEYFEGLLLEAIGENEACGVRRKPAPDSLLSVMEKIGAKKETTVYVGDSEVDIQTAANAGVDCISVVWGFKDEDFLRKNGGKIFVNEPMQIVEYCK